jgi:hypothetical protein
MKLGGNMTILKGGHLTATNKKHINYIIAQGWNSGESKKIKYFITSLENNVYSVTIQKNETSDFNGAKFVREHNYEISL